MMVDPSGYLPTWAKWTLGVTIIAASVGLSIATAGLATPIASAVGGGLFGAVVGGATAGAIGGAIASFGVSVGSQGISKGFDNVDWGKVGKDTAIGAGSGLVLGGAFGALRYANTGDIFSKSMSGLKNAQANFDEAALTLRNTPIATKGGVMTTERIAAQLRYNVASANLGFVQSSYNISLYSYRAVEMGTRFGLNQVLKNSISW